MKLRTYNGGAIATAYLRNCTTTSANEEQLTPFEKWLWPQTQYQSSQSIPNKKRENIKRNKECALLATARIQRITGWSIWAPMKLSLEKMLCLTELTFDLSKEWWCVNLTWVVEPVWRRLKVNINQRWHHKDHNKQFDVQTTNSILNPLTQL